ncbi:hypothetical protein PG990_003917 [Apiospora arundinis]
MSFGSGGVHPSSSGISSVTLETYLASESTVTKRFASGSTPSDEATSRRLKAKQLELEVLVKKVKRQ